MIVMVVTVDLRIMLGSWALKITLKISLLSNDLSSIIVTFRHLLSPEVDPDVYTSVDDVEI